MIKRYLLLCMTIGMIAVLSACGSKTTQTAAPGSHAATKIATETEEGVDDRKLVSSEEENSGEEETKGDDLSQEAADSSEDERGTYPDGSKPEYSGEKVRLTIDGQEVVIAMYDNTAAEAFLERLPMEELEFYDLSGIEKPVRTPEEPFSLGEEEPGFNPVTGEMVIYRPRGNFTIFYGDFRHSDELVPLGKVENGIETLAGQTDDFTGTMERIEAD